MYAYIRNGEIRLTSDTLFEKQIEEVAGMQTLTRKVEVDLQDEETGEVVLDKEGNPEKTTIDEEYSEYVVSQPFVPGLIYDEVIKYKIEGRVSYENGSIISWEELEEKKTLDSIVPEVQDPEKRKSEIREQLGKLSIQKAGSLELGEDISGIDSEISVLKSEFLELSPKLETEKVEAVVSK